MNYYVECFKHNESEVDGILMALSVYRMIMTNACNVICGHLENNDIEKAIKTQKEIKEFQMWYLERWD